MILSDINLPSMAIVIGCWEDHIHPSQKKLFQEILDFTNSCQQIEVVVVPNQHCVVTNPVWEESARSIFFDEQPVDWIRRYYTNLQTKQFTRLSRLLDNDTWANKVRISIAEQWQLEYLLNHVYPHIKNVYYFGIGWNVGMQRDYVGWGQLCQSVKHKHVQPVNILTHETLSLVNASVNNNLHYTKCVFEYPDFSNNDWISLDHNGIRYKQDYNWSYDNTKHIKNS
jgi:hypothetical protein